MTRTAARPDPAEDALRRELYLFALYRTLEASLLALMVFSPFGGLIGEPRDPFLAMAVAIAYLPMALALLLATRRDQSSLAWQACLGVGVDIAVAALITHAIPGAAPGVAMMLLFNVGAAALLLAQEPSRTPDDVERLLKASAYYDPAYMDRSGYGAGLLRVDGALGLPAPTGPADRTVPVQLMSPDASAAGELDLLTGTSTLLHLGAVEPATPLLATLQWRGVTLGAQAVVP